MKNTLGTIISLIDAGKAPEAERHIAQQLMDEIHLAKDKRITLGQLCDRLEPLHDFVVRRFADLRFSDWVYDALHEIDIFQTCLQIHHHSQPGSCMDTRRMIQLARNALRQNA